jgi:hypothetical protein
VQRHNRPRRELRSFQRFCRGASCGAGATKCDLGCRALLSRPKRALLGPGPEPALLRTRAERPRAAAICPLTGASRGIGGQRCPIAAPGAAVFLASPLTGDAASGQPGRARSQPAYCSATPSETRRRRRLSTLSPTACTSAICATSLGKLVRPAAQSRKVDRKPCTVMSPRHHKSRGGWRAVTTGPHHFTASDCSECVHPALE